MTFKASWKSVGDNFWCRVRYEMTFCASCKDLNGVGFDMSKLNCVERLCGLKFCEWFKMMSGRVICDCVCVPIESPK